jgi:hypothetical protein
MMLARSLCACGSPILAIAGLTACSLAATPAWAEVVLVRDGKPVAKLYADPAPAGGTNDATRDLDLAIREINYHLEKMAGVGLEVVRTDDPAAVSGPALVLGELAVKMGAKPQKLSESKEGFRLLAKGNRVLIGGESSAGMVCGVYDFLYRLGCDWVMPGVIGEIIPRKNTVAIQELDESQAPDFAFRRLWYRGYPPPRLKEEGERMSLWLRRQKGGNYSHPVSGTGGHVWDAFIKKHKAEFDKDPTMLALVKMPDGTLQRRGPQLESTHPRVIELFIQDIKNEYRKNIEAGKWTKDTVAGFGIGPADGLGYSLSPESLAAGSGRIDPIVGEYDRTDEMVLLGNRILQEVHKEYPNAYVGCYSYSTHAGFPVKYTPDPKYAQIFAPINFSRFHSLLDTNSITQPYYRKVVEQWGELSRKQGNLLTYRGYSWNLADNLLPYTKVRIWGEDLPFYKKQNFIGMNVEATKMWSVLAPSDYVFMRLAWNSSLDWKDVLREFCQKAYGKAAAAMERYHLALAERQSNARQEAGSFHSFPLMYDDAWVAEARKTLAEAAAAADTPADKERVGFTAHNVEMLRLYLDYFKATLAFDFPAARAGYDAMSNHWQKAYDQNTDLVANEGPAYLKRFLLKFVEQGLQYSSGSNLLVARLPDEMPTAFDKDEVGHLRRFHEPDFDDSAWVKTKTYSSTWSAQGLAMGNRSGAVWYRHRFELPAALKGKPIGLFLGGFEDEARVWLNGKLIGTSGRRFSNPAVYDLTDEAKPGAENLLAIMVVRNSAANEIGLGGLIRPSFVFTGSRIEPKAPGKTLELKQVLPGGDLNAP